ncbi:MAG: trans-sulfuration enzyme family protein [Rudaea sp.]
MPQNVKGLNTLAIHAGEEHDRETGALVPPLYLSTTFHLGGTEHGRALFAGQEEGFVYTRWGNPTVAVLERRIAALEGADAGLATASGMAAIATAILTSVRAGDHIVAAKAIYPSTFHFIEQNLGALGVQSTMVDASDPANLERAIRPNTRLIYVETPGNPLLSLVDLAAVAELGAKTGAVTICDNTFATPVNQQPLKLGIDIVVHSATKYLDGHGDAIGGFIGGKADFIHRASVETLRYFGGVLSPFNSYLILRGTQTLPLRVRRHNDNALAVAHFLESHPRVTRVLYPGLESHPQHALAKKQMSGFGGMISFEVRTLEEGARAMDRVRLCALATSLGDTRSLISHPASTSHSVLSREDRERQGVSDGLIRLSVGLEDVEDIIADLEQSLE